MNIGSFQQTTNIGVWQGTPIGVSANSFRNIGAWQGVTNVGPWQLSPIPSIVVVFSGQSNTVGVDETLVDYVCQDGAYNFLTDEWVSPAVDPAAGLGSTYICPFLDKFYELTGETVGSVPIAVSGKGILHPSGNAWSEDDSDCYTDGLAKCAKVDKIDFMIFWGSESDISYGFDEETFKAGAELMIANFRRDFNNDDLIIFVVKPDGGDLYDSTAVRAGWDSIVLEDSNVRYCGDAQGLPQVFPGNLHIAKAGMETLGVTVAESIYLNLYNMNYISGLENKINIGIGIGIGL
jgi:hypothetical protein